MENHCFSSQRRLKKPAEFGVVYQGNQTRVKGQYFTVLAFSRCKPVANAVPSGTIIDDSIESRLGVVASKKVSKLAVQRNRFKRLMRESFRVREHPNHFDFVAIARPGSASADNQALVSELDNLWGRLHKRCAAL